MCVAIAVETFKIIHKQSPSYHHDLISIKDQKYNFRHQDKAVLPRVRTTRYGLYSFRYNAAQIWNEPLFRVDINHTYNKSSNELLKSTMVYNNTYNHAYKHIK
jgi:hypothetical protein